MAWKSLEGKLLLAVSAFVVGSGLLISFLITQRYSATLFETMTAQGESIAQAVALEAADRVLVNDLVSLQKMLDHHLRSHGMLAYLFIHQGEEVLAHTFSGGVPAGLPRANPLTADGQSRLQRVVSARGDRYLDIAWPVFEGKAGVLRVGLSEKPYHKKVRELWMEMSLFTLGVLLLAVLGIRLFLRRVTHPLTALAHATEQIDQGNLGARVTVQTVDEIGRLAGSFNRMAARVEDYTRRLEIKASELERANQQARDFCHLVQQIGSLRTLNEIASCLGRQFRGMLQCPNQMVLLLMNSNRDGFFLVSGEETRFLGDGPHVQELRELLGETGQRKITLRTKPLLALGMQRGAPCTMVPIQHESETLGALLILCGEGCRCEAKDLDSIAMLLGQSVGVLGRAILDEEEARESRRRFDASMEFAGMIGKDPKMHGIYTMVEDIAPTDATVLIQGESGTGKEMVARAIHLLSLRKEKPFVVIDCSAYPETLLESELFGHEKGAFTGATRQKSGRFEQADGGTVFLDEIGEISPSAQIKLLRVLQSQRFERLGGEKTLTVNVRVLAATNKDLLQAVKAGRFREDLFYRLNVIPIHLPPLRERRNDIPLLARHFLARFAAEQKKTIDGFTPEAMRILLNYDWPGNVRELENGVEHAVVLAKGLNVEPGDLPSMVLETGHTHSPESSPRLQTMAEKEKELLWEALEKCGWNKKEAAKRLGISRNTLYQKLKRYRVARPVAH
ncbi:MAG: sigma 54-interacting transcriptional regulator [Thermodesulfobacteriota bacterium]